MATIEQFLQPLAVGSRVQAITDDLAASAAAGGYAAWIKSVTGSVPAVERLPDNRAAMVLSGDQNIKMQRWLDRQLTMVIQPPAEKPKVEYRVGSYLGPWAAKFAVPAGVAMFVLGWIAAYYFQR